MKTVWNYLEWYRKTNDIKKRLQASSKFSEYIISACWRKMEWRIGHWGSVGLMYNLTKVDKDSLLYCITEIDPLTITKNSDFKLSMYLQDMEKTSVLEKVLSYHKYIIPSDATLPSLPSKDNPTKVILPCLQRLCHGDDPYNLYNKETALEFHHLLIATLLYYARALRKLQEKHDKRRDRDLENKKKEKAMSNMKAKLEKDKRMEEKATFKSECKLDELDFQSAMAAYDGSAMEAAGKEGEDKQMGKKDQSSENDTFLPKPDKCEKSKLNTMPSSLDEGGKQTADNDDRLYLSTHPENTLFSHFTISNFADDITITCREIPTLSDTSRDLQDFAEAQHSQFTTLTPADIT